jgi:hypothetical protein
MRSCIPLLGVQDMVRNEATTNHRDMRYADDNDERPNNSVSICSSIGALGNNS